MKKSVGPRVIVEVEKRYQDEIKVSDLILQYDPMFRPTEHLNYSGVVKAIPENGFIPWADYDKDKKIDPIIRVGDKVFFRYIATDNVDLELDKSLSDTSKRMTISVHYSWVFCVVRDGEIIPVGGWCLGKPIIEGGGQEEIIDGHKVRVEYYGNTGIIKSIHTKKAKDKCLVSHIGTFINEDTELKIGDIAYGGENSGINFENKIEGQEFYCFKEHTVKAIL